MPAHTNFIDGFQKDHSELEKLFGSFQKAIESSRTGEAKEILNKIDDIATVHFGFEETYLYPRLRRLLMQMTEDLSNEQKAMREFVNQARAALSRGAAGKDKLSSVLGGIASLTELFKKCSGLAFLAEKFEQKDKDDLNQRFMECNQIKTLNAA